MTRVGIIGAGALGAMYGELLAKDPTVEFFFIAQGERLMKLQEQGLIINGGRFFPQVENPGASRPNSVSSEVTGLSIEEKTAHCGKQEKNQAADLIIFAVKHHHLPAALSMAAPFVDKNSVLMSVMNGVESEQTIGRCFGAEHVLFSVALGMDALREGNRLTYTTQGKTLIGREENKGRPDKDLRFVQELFTQVGIVWETPENMKRSLWYKFMINVGINQVSALLGAPFGVFQSNTDAQILMEKAMQEVVAVAEKEQVSLSKNDIEAWYTVLNTLSPYGKTSMLQDIEGNRKTEVEMLAGFMIKKGREFNISLPVNELLFHSIKVIESRKQ